MSSQNTLILGILNTWELCLKISRMDSRMLVGQPLPCVGYLKELGPPNVLWRADIFFNMKHVPLQYFSWSLVF